MRKVRSDYAQVSHTFAQFVFPLFIRKMIVAIVKLLVYLVITKLSDTLFFLLLNYYSVDLDTLFLQILVIKYIIVLVEL